MRIRNTYYCVILHSGSHFLHRQEFERSPGAIMRPSVSHFAHAMYRMTCGSMLPFVDYVSLLQRMTNRSPCPPHLNATSSSSSSSPPALLPIVCKAEPSSRCHSPGGSSRQSNEERHSPGGASNETDDVIVCRETRIEGDVSSAEVDNKGRAKVLSYY